MKLSSKTLLVVLSGWMCGILSFLFAITVVEQKALAVPVLPTEVGYKSITSIPQNEVSLPIAGSISNAVRLVDRILKSQHYNTFTGVEQEVRLESVDKEHSTVWRVFPYKTNAVVGHVEAFVYKDAALTNKDPALSFQMSFYPKSGALRDFYYEDKHEMLFVRTNGVVKLARHLGYEKWLIMKWNASGSLVSSNVHDYAVHGRIIFGASQTNAPTFHFGPRSAVDAATNSWRQEME